MGYFLTLGCINSKKISREYHALLFFYILQCAYVVQWLYPSVIKTLTQCWFNVDPSSTTLDQHWVNIDPASCVCWDNIFKSNVWDENT